jgi:cyclophilin family peptidyl-prolyl cis-trans isomerase
MKRRIASFGLGWGLLLAASSGFGQPSLEEIPELTLLSGSPLHVPLLGQDPSGEAIRFSATTSDELVTATVLEGNRSLRIHVANFGVMTFELFDGRAPRATHRIVELADGGFYNGMIFHRVIDDFVIQGGDPTGTGAGASGLGPFDDQFHVDLQHNRTGLISMAKAGDDSNDAQFFITEGPQRHLDFNHTIFGILVRGEDVREAISQVSVDSNDRPEEDVVIESAESFIDEQDGVLMLKAPEGATGSVDVTVTAQNASGLEASRTFRVNVTPDTVNSPPFLADIPEITTKVDTPVTYQLEAIDVEGDPAKFLDQNSMSGNGLPIPVIANPNLVHSVDFDTGLLTISPTNGLTGTHVLSVATAVSIDAVDYQVVTIVIEP